MDVIFGRITSVNKWYFFTHKGTLYLKRLFLMGLTCEEPLIKNVELYLNFR